MSRTDVSRLAGRSWWSPPGERANRSTRCATSATAAAARWATPSPSRPRTAAPQVTLITTVAAPGHERIATVRVDTAAEMDAAVRAALPGRGGAGHGGGGRRLPGGRGRAPRKMKKRDGADSRAGAHRSTSSPRWPATRCARACSSWASRPRPTTSRRTRCASSPTSASTSSCSTTCPDRDRHGQRGQRGDRLRRRRRGRRTSGNAPRPRWPPPCWICSRIASPDGRRSPAPGAAWLPTSRVTAQSTEAIPPRAAATGRGHVAVAPDTGAILPKDTYTYAVPDHLAGLAVPGARVMVPFGPREVLGYVVGVDAALVGGEATARGRRCSTSRPSSTRRRCSWRAGSRRATARRSAR